MIEPTDEQVEAAAKAAHAAAMIHYPSMTEDFYGWDVMKEYDREGFRIQARAALTAAPHTPPESIVEVTNRLLFKYEWDPTFGVRKFAAELEKWLAEVERAAAEKAWTEGVATALNFAKREPDGITLKLVTIDGAAWVNPYRRNEGEQE